MRSYVKRAYMTAEDKLRRRIEKLKGWLGTMNAAYEELQSRREELTGAESGWDPAPQQRPCEHRLEWFRGRLCLACDNTGWRLLAPGEEGLDPYSADLPKTTTGIKLDESLGAKRARSQARLAAEIEALERNERVRRGLEDPEDKTIRNLRLVSRQPRMIRKIARALDEMRVLAPEEYLDLPSTRSLIVLSELIPGRIDPAPQTG